ncbi:GNAT family N-acetyltransferase [Laspinema olomoucense]|uniref:GNAT family N-acetyltransferase n=1 Tax=Laspinema olomoucense D3b TaxID=2953688 RepID=A0ABT2N212_9CYAN|nr:GNAT family N-acetyltransferase [Laspinema sp. D3b]MCT7976718.1 GNAT family N-acetyltransferase [Laspinema sp. D3b]
MINIIDLGDRLDTFIEPLSELLLEGFRENWREAWPTIEAARQEVLDSLTEDRINRVAINDAGQVVGWVGGISQYNGHVWEVHPLVVAADYRRQGIGRTLLKDLEEQVRIRGALTLWLGTDDEMNMTSLSGVNLYSNLWEKIQTIQNLRGHPYQFYQKCGFEIVGVMPDANGRGKPDIFMAKSLNV